MISTLLLAPAVMFLGFDIGLIGTQFVWWYWFAKPVYGDTFGQSVTRIIESFWGRRG